MIIHLHSFTHTEISTMVGNAKIFLVYLAMLSTVLGTHVHVNRGCIDINLNPVCGGTITTIRGGEATFYARFDGSDVAPTAIPGCILHATWPAYYGEIYFGADNCLYDDSGKAINDQCCDEGTGGDAPVPNPYASTTICGGNNRDAKCPGSSCVTSVCWFACCQGPTPITNPLSCSSVGEKCICANTCGCCI